MFNYKFLVILCFKTHSKCSLKMDQENSMDFISEVFITIFVKKILDREKKSWITIFTVVTSTCNNSKNVAFDTFISSLVSIFEALIKIAFDLLEIKINLIKSKFWLKTMKINVGFSCFRWIHIVKNLSHCIIHYIIVSVIHIFNSLTLFIQILNMFLFLIPVLCWHQQIFLKNIYSPELFIFVARCIFIFKNKDIVILWLLIIFFNLRRLSISKCFIFAIKRTN